MLANSWQILVLVALDLGCESWGVSLGGVSIG